MDRLGNKWYSRQDSHLHWRRSRRRASAVGLRELLRRSPLPGRVRAAERGCAVKELHPHREFRRLACYLLHQRRILENRFGWTRTSIPRLMKPLLCFGATKRGKCSRRESHPHPGLRRAVLCLLSYVNIKKMAAGVGIAPTYPAFQTGTNLSQLPSVGKNGGPPGRCARFVRLKVGYITANVCGPEGGSSSVVTLHGLAVIGRVLCS